MSSKGKNVIILSLVLMGMGSTRLVVAGNIIPPTNVLPISAMFVAKEMCSCLFVQKFPEAYCREWVKASPDLSKPSVDYKTKTVTGKALLGVVSRKAKFISDTEGCR